MPKKDIYQKYKSVVNMTATELRKWAKNPLSKKASLDRKPLIRNIRLLSTPMKNWTQKDEINAKKTISFISRMKKVPKGDIVGTYRGNKYSKRDISLKNWAYNPFKRRK